MNNKFLKKFKNLLCKKKNLSEDEKLLKKIEGGFENNEFEMHLQFIVDNKTKEIISAEALSRWESPSGEIILPGTYIGLMEKSGLIVKFDYYMFEKVCKKLSEWKNTDFNNITISCNITRITISEKNFVTRIKEIAGAYDFDRNKLMIEITEDSIEKNTDIARNNVIKAKELGFCVALDDLGNGYTTLSNLCDYPIDIVKIDRDILLKTEKDKGKEMLVGIIALAHSLNMKVTCEGVETSEQNELVSGSDCDYIQGWYYSKAIPLEECEAFIERYTMA